MHKKKNQEQANPTNQTAHHKLPDRGQIDNQVDQVEEETKLNCKW